MLLKQDGTFNIQDKEAEEKTLKQVLCIVTLNKKRKKKKGFDWKVNEYMIFHNICHCRCGDSI